MSTPTSMSDRFQDLITTEEELRAVLGRPGRGAVAKALDHIDGHFAGFIAQSPFVLIGSSDAAGNQDVSPKGDPAGFVLVLDEHTLAIPDRPGNHRGDTFSNVLQNPNVALFFMVPGVRETLRVQGHATIVRDQALRERMAVGKNIPELALVIEVTEAFMHCAKCVVRSHLWQPDEWPDPADVPNLAAALVEQINLSITRDKMVAAAEKDARENLY